MLWLVWFFVAGGVLGTSIDLTTLKDYLQLLDSSLPLTSAVDFKICYHFDLKQACASDTIDYFLGQSIPNLLTWEPSEGECESLLDTQRAYLESIAGSLFPDAITSSNAEGGIAFELLAQSWVLRVTHTELALTYGDFVDSINSIEDWTSVYCDGDNLAYDSTSVPKPDFLDLEDCAILGSKHVTDNCAIDTCTLLEAADCCTANPTAICCQAKQSILNGVCGNELICDYKTYCCSWDSSSPAALGNRSLISLGEFLNSL